MEEGKQLTGSAPFLPLPLTRGHIAPLPLGDPISPARQKSPHHGWKSPHTVRVPSNWGTAPRFLRGGPALKILRRLLPPGGGDGTAIGSPRAGCRGLRVRGNLVPQPGGAPRARQREPDCGRGRALLTVPVTPGRPFHPRVGDPFPPRAWGGPWKRGWVGAGEGREDGEEGLKGQLVRRKGKGGHGGPRLLGWRLRLGWGLRRGRGQERGRRR